MIIRESCVTRRLICTIGVAVAGVLTGAAAPVDPYADFAEYIVNNEGVLWSSGAGQPPGGYLFRFTLDVTGDGVDELFISSSLEATGKYAMWHVYESTGTAGGRLDEDLPLWPRNLFVRRTEHATIVSTFQNSDINTLNLSKFEFMYRNRNSERGRLVASRSGDAFTIADLENDGWDTSDLTELAERLGLGTKVSRPVQKVLLARWLADQNTEWTSYNEDLNPDSQHKDPSDFSSIASVANFPRPAGVDAILPTDIHKVEKPVAVADIRFLNDRQGIGILAVVIALCIAGAAFVRPVRELVIRCFCSIFVRKSQRS